MFLSIYKSNRFDLNAIVVLIRYIPTLDYEDVADRTIEALRCNEECVVIPTYLQVLLKIKKLVAIIR